LRLATLERDQFLAAVTGHADARSAGEQVVTTLISRARPKSLVSQ
jgi:hypothetical protein